MRKIVLSLVAAGAALVSISPASAQYYPSPQPAPYGSNYGYGYNNGYGFRGNWGQVRAFQMRIDNIERQINRLDRRDVIRGRTADRLRDEANRIEERLHDRARGGLSPREAGDLEFRIQRLEQRVQFALNDRGRYGYGDHDRDRD
jgi:hypothetical protein